MILGDFGYGAVLVALSLWLGSKPFAVDPLAQKGMTVLRWMGVWCIIWGIIFAEGFGFVWDGSMYDATGRSKTGTDGAQTLPSSPASMIGHTMCLSCPKDLQFCSDLATQTTHS